MYPTEAAYDPGGTPSAPGGPRLVELGDDCPLEEVGHLEVELAFEAMHDLGVDVARGAR